MSLIRYNIGSKHLNNLTIFMANAHNLLVYCSRVYNLLTMTTKQKPKRRYKLITNKTVADFMAALAIHGNATAAVRAIDPTVGDPYRRATLIALKSRELDAGEYIDHKMQQGAIEAIERVNTMIQSADEKIATKNAHFIIDHVRGKALQRSETKHLNLNIEAVLE